MSRIVAAVVDIDGTLVHQGRGASVGNAAALREFEARDGKLIFATARTFEGAREAIGHIVANPAYVAELGATIIVDGRLLRRITIASATVHLIVDAAARSDLNYVLTSEGTNHPSSDRVKPRSGNIGKRIGAGPIPLNGVTRMVFHGEPTPLLGTLKQLTDVQVSWGDAGQGGARDLVVSPSGVSKLSGVEDVCRKLGIDLQSVLAIGDSSWDRDLISASGVGVVVDGGQAELRACADWVAPTADQDAVAATFRHFGLI